MFRVSLGVLLALALTTTEARYDPTTEDRYEPTWDSLDARPLPDWYDEAKIGIFLHWGVFSVPSFGSEWFWSNWATGQASTVDFMNKNYKPNFTYPEFAPKFTAEFYDPNVWADLFKAAGVKYVVLTSKHHEGYTLWPSKYSWNWNAKATGSGRDLLGELATAIRTRTDIQFGLYHSLFEWYHPLYLQDKAAAWKSQSFVKSKTMPELQELVNTYRPSVIWSDGDWEAPDTYWTSKEFLAWLYNDSPVKDVVVTNDRWGSGCACKHGGYMTCSDKYNPGTLQKRKWENAMTLDKGSWGFRRNAPLADFLTTDELIQTLAETVSCGGNLLLNVGPTHDGIIKPIFEERLRGLGKWLSVNGEAIYATKPWTFQNDTITPGVWFTSKGSTVYAIVLNWPAGNKLDLGVIKPPSTQMTISMLGYGNTLKWKKSPKGITITWPALTPNLLPCDWAWVLQFDNLADYE